MKKIRKLTLAYFYYYLVRQGGSSNSIAMGVAIGIFIGFLVPVGGQIVVAILLAFLLRASKITAFAGTWVTNPYTIPFIYPAQCYFGSILLRNPLSFREIRMVFSNLFEKPDWNSLSGVGQEILVPFFVGGFVFGAMAAFFGYFAAYGLVEHYRSRRKKKLNRKLAMISKRISASGNNQELEN